jgi:hypothetical protein
MAIYEITQSSIVELKETTFSATGIKERGDLQRLLRGQVDIISPDTLVIAEEFGEWEDSKRRIDLLGLDKDANLVVIELKRTEDGGHMDLQAVRYAAMVSTMTFDKVVELFGQHLKTLGQDDEPRAKILEFLGWESPDEGEFAQDVRIVLASAEFSREVTTAVMWLNDRALDIRCVRLKPYKHGAQLMLDVQQVIPLPEAAEYQVKIRDKEQRGRQERAERYSQRRTFWEGLLGRAKSRTQLHANTSAGDYGWVGASSGRRGLNLNYVVGQHDARVELYIDRGAESTAQNKEIFDRLHERKAEAETAFGQPLDWDRLDGRRACRISYAETGVGFKDAPEQVAKLQDTMVDAMIRLEKALRPAINALQLGN